ncbi:MFS transporter [Streptomyces sp. NPDC049881]|uniref:MDR family MFS transporter n=1 Tax=Streptomyces sp. NPDC049881 TaxID=3155778 RepID=UPI003435DA81
MLAPAPVRTRLRDLPASFWWLWLAVLVTWTGRFVVPFMTLFLTKDAGLSVSEAGLIVSGYGGGVVVSTLVGGVLADVVGRRRTLVGSMVASAATMTVIPSFPQPATIAALLFLFGLVNGAAQPAVAALITDLVPAVHRRAAFAYNYWAVNLGFALGPLLAGFIADRAFSLLFYAQAAVLLTSAAIVLGGVRDVYVPQRRRRATAGPAPAAGARLRDVLSDRVFMSFVAVMFVYCVVYVQSTVSLPVAMTDQGFTTQQYGLLLTLNGILLCALQIPTARLFARWRRELTLCAAMVVTAVGVGLQAFADTWVLYAVAVSVWTLGEMGGHPSAQSIAADMSTLAARGRYLGTYALAFSSATMVGPLVGGGVVQFAGSAALWSGCAVVCLAIALVLLLTAPSREARVVRAQTGEDAGPDARHAAAPGVLPDAGTPADRTGP